MTACERCWELAFTLSKTLGGHQADRYRELVDGAHDHEPCSCCEGKPYGIDWRGDVMTCPVCGGTGVLL